LPDGLFSNQKYKFEYILEGLGMKNVGLFYGHLECNKAIWYILWAFGNLVAIWYIFQCFGILNIEKSGNPVLDPFSFSPFFLESCPRPVLEKWS
jgi:hypothetical protein